MSVNIVQSEWITANAGSGKTTALTERVVGLLLQGVSPEHIVCITYTKAAASEMRARVLEMLRKLLLENDNAARVRITKLTGLSPDEAQLAHARSLFGRVLDSPTGGLQLTTIHGFCQAILSRFPMEAGIAPHFTVLEEVAADELLSKAKHAVLAGLESAEDGLAAAIAHIGTQGGEFRFDQWAREIVRQRTLWNEIWRGHSPESLRGHLCTLHGIDEGLSNETLDDWLCAYADSSEAEVIRGYLPQLLAHSTKTYREFGEGLAAWLADAPRGDSLPLKGRAGVGPDVALAAPTSCPHLTSPLEGEERVCGASALQQNIPHLVSLFMTADGERRKRLLNAKEFPAEHPLAIAVEKFASAVERYVQRAAALACVADSFAIAQLARVLLSLYAQAKEARHALDYDDLIAHTLMLFSQPETLGWVMRKLDYRIDHLLIDEAQDNSGAMWQLAQILVEELIASNDGVGNAGLPRSVLVVGDEKQSIYSFQGAAPEQFAHYNRVFQTMLDGSPSPLAQRSLTHSYRSAKAVLQWVDTVCAQPVISAAIQASGAAQQHLLTRDAACGRVVLYPPIIAPEKESRPALALPLEYHYSATAPQLLAEHIAQTVQGWLSENRLLESAGRPLKPGDILILVKNRKPLVQPLIRALQRCGVPVAGLDRLMLADHLAVRDLLALMAWCLNVGDDLALAQVLRSPLIGWSDEQLREAAHGRAGSLWHVVDEPWLAEVLRWKTFVPHDFLTQVLEVSGRRRHFARRFGEEVHEVLDELKAQAAAMPESLLPTLAHFHDWISRSGREIKREQEGGSADVVRIMTVHGAKGLEAPVVLLADTVSVPTTANERLFTITSPQNQRLPVLSISARAKQAAVLARAKEKKRESLLAEYYRLLYVAITRPRDELHVFGMASKAGETKAGSWYEVAGQVMRTLGAEEQDGVMEWCDAPSGIVKTDALPTMIENISLPSWAENAPAAAEKAMLLTPSRLVASQAQPSPYIMRAGGNARERGVRIHRVLELLQAESDAKEIRQWVDYIAPDWTEKERLFVNAEIAQLFTQERWLWEHPRLPEASVAGTVTLGGEPYAVNGQIDLLVNMPEQVVILDYKTGPHVPTSAADVPLSYLLQLKLYREVLAQLYPTKQVRCAILWTAKAQLMWLDDAVEATPFPAIKTLGKSSAAA